MNWIDFQQSLQNEHPPEGLSVALESLWHAGRDDWESAHDLVNDLESNDAMLVHAYLHRIEPDLSNAAYWYRRAGFSMPEIPPKQEWERLVKQLLAES